MCVSQNSSNPGNAGVVRACEDAARKGFRMMDHCAEFVDMEYLLIPCDPFLAIESRSRRIETDNDTAQE